MNRPFIFISPSKLEHYRYFRFFCLDDDEALHYGDVQTMFKLLKVDISDSVFVLNGLRFPDKVLMKLCKYKAWNLIVLQHNAYVPSYTFAEKIKKSLVNLGKYLLWFGWTLLLVAILCTRRRGNKPRTRCWCFSSQFAAAVNKFDPACRTEVLSPPDMRIYGSLEANLSSQNIRYFFIDEPFEKTLGVCSLTILKGASTLLPEGATLHIKLHPRSDAKKYTKCNLNIEIIDFYPEAVDVLFTYKSNLGEYYRPIEAKYIFDPGKKKFRKAKLESGRICKKRQYIQECKMKLNSIRWL